jgi:hypothetical protein
MPFRDIAADSLRESREITGTSLDCRFRAFRRCCGKWADCNKQGQEPEIRDINDLNGGGYAALQVLCLPIYSRERLGAERWKPAALD